jgi:hypothetical protein
MKPGAAAPVEVARGLLLLGVFHVHALYALLEHLRDPELRALALLQAKFLTPHVVLFFALAGMTGRALANKPAALMVHRSLSLWLLAVASHLVGVLIDHALWKPWSGVQPIVRDLATPIVLGTGWWSFGWFFVVLAIVRLFAYAWARDRRTFVVAAVGATAVVAASLTLGLSDNFFEWRSWPAAFVLFMIGQRLHARWRIPHWAGVLATLAGLLLPAFNHPAVLTDGPCLTCSPQTLAEPMVGYFGLLPVFVLQTAVSLVGLLWLAPLLRAGAIGRLLSYIGQRSMQFLVLHGWLSFSVFGVAGYLPLQSLGAWLFVAIIVVNPLVHLALYRMLRIPLDRLVALCASASRRLIALFSTPGTRHRGKAPRSPR